MNAPVTRRELVLLALPAAASALLNNAFRVIDQLAAGGISTPAQAAIGSCTFVLIAAYGVHCLIAAGVGPLVARALAWSQPLVAWEALAEGVLLGAGASRPVFWLSAPLNALRIPLAWALSAPLGWGAVGVWWAINVTSLGKAALKGWCAARGSWAATRI